MDIARFLLPDPTLLLVDAVEIDETSPLITLVATVTQASACCPLCEQSTTRVHSRYRRTVTDLPWADVPVRLRLAVRRFICDNPVCARAIFCERILSVALAWARRTQRLARAQTAIGLAAGGAGGSRLCAALSMQAGIDLLLALIRQLPLPERATPTVLGVDDWAQRKGQVYRTILVDLEQSCVVEVLPDRTAETLAQWLREHPGVTISARDRAGAYAEGIMAGAPAAVQVADRWHLLKNLTDALHKVLQAYQHAIEQSVRPVAPTVPGAESAEAQATQVIGAADARGARAEDEGTCEASAADIRRAERIAETHRLHQRGWTGNVFAAHLMLSPKTVRRYLKTTLPIMPQRRTRTGRLLDAFKPYLVERWKCDAAMVRDSDAGLCGADLDCPRLCCRVAPGKWAATG